MAGTVDLLVVGRDVASAALAGYGACAGLRVRLVVPTPPEASAPFGGVLRAPDLAAFRSASSSPPPLERPITVRRLGMLSDAAAMAVEFADVRAQAEPEPVHSVREDRLAEWLQRQASGFGASVSPGRAGGLVRSGGRVVGIELDGATTPATIVALGTGAVPASVRAAPGAQLSRLFPLAQERVAERFGPGGSRGISVEYVLGGRGPGEQAVGFLLPYRDAIEAGVRVRTTRDPGEFARWALGRLAEHPQCAEFLRGSSAAAESPVVGEPTGPRRYGGRGWLSVGPELGLTVPRGLGAVRSVGHELSRALAAGKASVEAVRGGGDPSDVVPKFRHYLAAAGLIRLARQSREIDHRLRFAPQWQRRYPAVLASLCDALMTESGGPKRRIVDTVRSVRGAYGPGWTRIAADLLRVGGGLG